MARKEKISAEEEIVLDRRYLKRGAGHQCNSARREWRWGNNPSMDRMIRNGRRGKIISAVPN